ncbi:hypothetical protein BMJ22_05815 [Sinorhizobium medicae]|nr:hypothetical protein BMJ22_05815 [Sinorhizobium medicae]
MLSFIKTSAIAALTLVTITAAPVYQTTTATAVSAPRLSKILSELRAANQRMKSKRSVGELTTVALNKLRHEAAIHTCFGWPLLPFGG